MSLLKRSFGNTGSGAFSGNESADTSDSGAIRASAAQRIRVGLTGLAAIFLLVMIAAVSLKPGQSVAAAASPGEPLAVLGVAPGAGPATFERPAEPARPEPRASRI